MEPLTYPESAPLPSTDLNPIVLEMGWSEGSL